MCLSLVVPFSAFCSFNKVVSMCSLFVFFFLCFIVVNSPIALSQYIYMFPFYPRENVALFVCSLVRSRDGSALGAVGAAAPTAQNIQPQNDVVLGLYINIIFFSLFCSSEFQIQFASRYSLAHSASRPRSSPDFTPLPELAGRPCYRSSPVVPATGHASNLLSLLRFTFALISLL